MIRWAGMTAALLAIGGCGGSLLESDAPAERIYTLQSRAGPMDVSAAREPLAVQLSVARPRVAPGLDTERIAVRARPHELDYYRAARWGAPTAVVVQGFVVDNLRRSGAFALVTPDDSPAAADYLLDLELEDFQAEQRGDTTPAVRVSIVATLIDIRSAMAVDSFQIQRESTAGANRLADVVAALARAADEASTEIADRAATALRDRQVTAR